MTWSEMITISSENYLNKKEVIRMFYGLDAHPPRKDLVDIALLCSPGSDKNFCIRLTWQGEIPERGKSDFGAKLMASFSKKGRAGHTVWQREGSLVFMNPEPIIRTVENRQVAEGASR